MIYLGNFKNKIKQEWIDEILSIDGIISPRDLWGSEVPHTEDRHLESLGYRLTAEYYIVIYAGMLSFEKEINDMIFELVPEHKELQWWVTKMGPGQFIPLHRDLRIAERQERYWMTLTNESPGHLIMYEDEVITKYQVGDTWQLADSEGRHAAANLGSGIRIALNFGIVL